MRALCIVALAAGCHPTTSHSSDAAPPDSLGDGPLDSCSAAPGTASVTAHVGVATASYDRLYAGGIWLTGPVKLAGAPFALKLVFAQTSPIAKETGVCCGGADRTCCAIDAIAASIDNLPDGGELGSHAATVENSWGTMFMLPGTLTITEWAHPFMMSPGRIAGSISVATDTVTIDGTFDNQFCAGLLSATI